MSLGNQSKTGATLSAIKWLFHLPALTIPVGSGTYKTIRLQGFLLLMNDLGSPACSRVFSKKQDATGTFVQTGTDMDAAFLVEGKPLDQTGITWSD